jgi:hypothetical protein
MVHIYTLKTIKLGETRIQMFSKRNVFLQRNGGIEMISLIRYAVARHVRTYSKRGLSS